MSETGGHWRRILRAAAPLAIALGASGCVSNDTPGAAQAEIARPVDGAIWVTLGTSGGPPVRAERAQISNALLAGDAAYLFDTGNDVQRQMARAGIDETAVRVIFLSHHHLDHIADLGPLIWIHWTFGQGVLRIVGPVGTGQLVDGLVAASAPITHAAYLSAGRGKASVAEMLEVIEIAPDLAAPQEVWRDDRITVSAIGVDHYQVSSPVPLESMPQAVAYRVEAGGRRIVYSGDSGPSQRLAEIAAGADLFVTEVIELEAIAVQMRHDFADAPPGAMDNVLGGMALSHLTPREVGRMAVAGEIGAVLLTHFVPIPENVPDAAIYRREIGENYSGPVTLAEDLGRY